MPQSIIIHIPGGPVPVYALRLMDSLKTSGIGHVHLTVGHRKITPPAGFPKRWESPLTVEATEASTATLPMHASLDTEAIHIQLGDHGTDMNKPAAGHVIRCSLTEGYAGHCFPAIVRALSKNDGSIEVTIDARKIGSDTRTLVKGYFKTIPHSYRQTLEIALEGAIRLIADVTKSSVSGTGTDSTEIDNYQPFTTHAPLTPSELLNCIREVRLAKIKKRFRQAFFIERWNIGIIDAPIHEVALSSNTQWRVEWMKEPHGTQFQADPFGISNSKGQLILFEHMQDDRGRIHAYNDGKPSPILTENKIHFSYPYTFVNESTVYMVPESSFGGEIRIYPIDQPSLELGEPIRLATGIHAVDPSIVHHNRHWWLFCTDRAAKGADTRLHLYFADKLTGPWKPHPMNPIKTDIRSARPAGHLFIHEGVLYRPSQDSSITYGGRIIINRIDLLDENRFSETPVNTIGPEMLIGPYNQGTHTISALGNKTCIDGKRRVFHPIAFQRFFT